MIVQSRGNTLADQQKTAGNPTLGTRGYSADATYGPTPAANTPVPPTPGAQPPSPGANPTTLYSGNVDSKYVPDQNSRIEKMSQTGSYGDGTGNNFYPNGNVMDTNVSSGELMNDPSYRLLEDMRSRSDATTDSYISSIQDNYRTSLIPQQEEVNRAEAGGVQNALFRYGANKTGSGMHALGAVATHGLQAIATLQAQENNAIAQARQSQDEGDFKTAEDQIAIAENIRKDKQAQAKSIYDEVAKKQEATQKGIDDLTQTMRNNGAPSSLVNQVMSSQDLGQAVELAGVYGNGGSGTVGEYNRYVADATAHGVSPMGYSEYQDMDANRKRSVVNVGTGTAGLTSAQATLATKLSDDYEQRSKDFYQQRDAFNRIQASATDPSAAGDLALIFNYMKVLDPGSTVREGEFANAQNAGSAWNSIGAKYNQVVNGERLTETQRKDFTDRASKLFNSAKKQQDEVVGEFQGRADQYGVPADLIVRSTDATGSTANDALQAGIQAKQSVNDYITSNPLEAMQVSGLYMQGFSDQDVYDYLLQSGKIQ